MRKPRNSNRGTLQYFEDAFADLDCATQEKMLETLASLHRWSKRERARKQQPTPAASLELHLAEIPPSEREA